MPLKLFNTLTRKKEDFKSIGEGQVNMYSCGPTVYHYVHLGNLRAYIFVDLLRKYLEFKGFKVKHVMNITDVDDKTIKNSQKEKKPLKEFTEFYTKEFLEDIKTLNIQTPSIMPKATEYIKEMTDIIQKLKQNGHTYEKNGSTYFKISTFKDYGNLAKLDPESLKKNADGRLNDADEYEKDDARDFALWKAYDKEDGDVFWETPIGKGRPGWHIECSAMSTRHLGNHFDIHTGGIDLIFPHHTNEIAQSEGANKTKFVNYWIHNAHLIVNGEKMSKSLGNFYTLRDLLKKGYDPKAIRYELLTTHYRQQLDFREDNLKKIPETLNKFTEFLDKLDLVIDNGGSNGNDEIDSFMESAERSFTEALDDDLNISEALAAVFTFLHDTNKIIESLSKEQAQQTKQLMQRFDSVLGVMEQSQIQIPKEVQQLVQQREEYRKSKDWKKSDELRDKIKEAGYEVKDTNFGSQLKKI